MYIHPYVDTHALVYLANQSIKLKQV
uniref:Uncharacterized protein n=1 Tax=Rhizophora mucronata TaxID=61149 RepID=A0A2P2MQY2_RHIMU